MFISITISAVLFKTPSQGYFRLSKTLLVVERYKSTSRFHSQVEVIKKLAQLGVGTVIDLEHAKILSFQSRIGSNTLKHFQLFNFTGLNTSTT